jgi:Zn-dependent M16 (insulinase) family peptidase
MLINRAGLLCNLTVDEHGWQSLQHRLVEFCGEIEQKEFQQAIWKAEALPVNEGLTIPAQVNYVGKAANLYNLGYDYHGSVAVITNTLRTTWLYEKVRLRGGAYGGTCAFDRHSGVFSYLSYRDPNVMETLESYAGSANFLISLDLSQAELVKSIIGTIGEMDTYLLPDAKGYTSMVRYLTGDTNEERQQRRAQVLGTTREDFGKFGEVLEAMNATGRVVVMGAQEAIQRVNSQQPGFLAVEKVL